MTGRKVSDKPRTPITIPILQKRAASGTHIAMVTAYDSTFAQLFDEAGVDAILVGDSLGMVVQGRDDTLAVTLEDIVYHTRAVRRGVRTAHIVADMPFMTYQTDSGEALRNAGRLISEGGAHAVKLEGGLGIGPTIERIVTAGIPVMGHVGLTPQSVHALGGFRVQGKDVTSAQRIMEDAKAVEAAGAYAIVLEGIPRNLAKDITETLSIPTIGIGAGPDCGGQVLVGYDLLGLTPSLRPKFVKRFAELF
ncbi:MAG: 3-methyl-2-oxobutanoate hydroxymethyltransferase, partial [Myxococcales bacterium]|nr:3-methyl-2-oxobutanoate hydroxymethyltransferase [Myxococcales bacterium]